MIEIELDGPRPPRATYGEEDTVEDVLDRCPPGWTVHPDDWANQVKLGGGRYAVRLTTQESIDAEKAGNEGYSPTHLLVFVSRDRTIRVVTEVMLTDDGAAYTAGEWDTASPADWTYTEETGWRWCGQATIAGANGTVTAIPLAAGQDEKLKQVAQLLGALWPQEPGIADAVCQLIKGALS